MNYHTLYKLSRYLNNDKVNKITSLDKYNSGYKNTYLYKPLLLRIYHKYIKNCLNHNYKLKVYGINTLEELKQVINYNVTIIGIEFGNTFDDQISKYDLPNTLKYIDFGHFFNKNVDNLPEKLRIIKFGAWFNRSVDKLPPAVKFIKFGTDFNQSVDKLPPTVKFIKFGTIFNQSVDNLPQSLKSIAFHNYFNKSVDNLPQSLELITFGENFDQSLKNLPKTVKKIKLHATTHIRRLELPPNICVKIYGYN